MSEYKELPIYEIERSEKRWQELLDAIKKGDAGAIRMIIATPGMYILNRMYRDPNDSTPFSGVTTLMLAVEGGHADCAQALIDGVKADKRHIFPFEKWLNKKSDRKSDNMRGVGETALEMAIKNGDVDCARVLIKAGADINTQDIGSVGADKRTPLSYAADQNQPEIVKLLLAAGAQRGRGDQAVFTEKPWLTGAEMERYAECGKLLSEAAEGRGPRPEDVGLPAAAPEARRNPIQALAEGIRNIKTARRE